MIAPNSPATIRIVCVVLVGAIILILAAASRVGFRAEESKWCDIRTTNCYDKLGTKIVPFTGENR